MALEQIDFISQFGKIYPNSIAITRKEYLIERCMNKKLFIYGISQEAVDINNYLCAMGLCTQYFLDEENVGGQICDRPIISPIDIVYEMPGSFFVIIAKSEAYYGISRQMFLNQGLTEDIDFTYHSEMPLTKEAKCYDVTLSYNRTVDTIEGFEVFGDTENPSSRLIVALGGSTTESTYLFIKGWAQYLAEMLMHDHIPAKIYCGGVAGYSSSQELLKLLRDVLPMKPDIVISYSGLNDLYGYPKPEEKIRNGRPFITHFQVEFIAKIIEKLQPTREQLPVMHDLLWQENGNTTVYYGLKNQKSASELWLDNTRIMHAIAEEFGFIFISFFQPFAFNGFYEITDVQKIIYRRKSPTCIHDGFEKWGAPYTHDVKKIISAVNNYDYIYDFSRIFEEEEGVYFDASHVYERGNVIIAKKIYEKILPKLKEMME